MARAYRARRGDGRALQQPARAGERRHAAGLVARAGGARGRWLGRYRQVRALRNWPFWATAAVRWAVIQARLTVAPSPRRYRSVGRNASGVPFHRHDENWIALVRPPPYRHAESALSRVRLRPRRPPSRVPNPLCDGPTGQGHKALVAGAAVGPDAAGAGALRLHHKRALRRRPPVRPAARRAALAARRLVARHLQHRRPRRRHRRPGAPLPRGAPPGCHLCPGTPGLYPSPPCASRAMLSPRGWAASSRRALPCRRCTSRRCTATCRRWRSRSPAAGGWGSTRSPADSRRCTPPPKSGPQPLVWPPRLDLPPA
jgi:hypothetical protein